MSPVTIHEIAATRNEFFWKTLSRIAINNVLYLPLSRMWRNLGIRGKLNHAKNCGLTKNTPRHEGHIAVAHREPGMDAVLAHSHVAIVSAVNHTEVVSKLARTQLPAQESLNFSLKHFLASFHSTAIRPTLQGVSTPVAVEPSSRTRIVLALLWLNCGIYRC